MQVYKCVQLHFMIVELSKTMILVKLDHCYALLRETLYQTVLLQDQCASIGSVRNYNHLVDPASSLKD